MSFVRDGSLNRRKRRLIHQILSAHNIESDGKKIHKTNDKTTAQSDFATSTRLLNFDESTDNRLASTVVVTEKKSRYSNAKFMQSKAFLYLNYKKMKKNEVNKSLKEHLKQFDKNETHLKELFEKCYNVTNGSIKKSLSMMKQIETETRVIINHPITLSSEIRNRLPMFSRKDKKTFKRVDNMEDKKNKAIRLMQIIDNKNLILFGKYNSKKDKKILYSNRVINTVPKIDENYYDSRSSDNENNESENNCCRLTKSYSLHSIQKDSFRVTKDSKSRSVRIGRKKPFSRKKNPINNVEETIVSQPKKNGIVQNAANKSLLKKNIYVEKIMIPQLKIDETVQNVKKFGLKIVEENVTPHLKKDKCVENDQDSALKIVEDSGEIMIPRSIEVENIENTKSSALESNIDIEKIMIPQSKMDKYVENDQDSALEIVEDSGEIMIPRSIEVDDIENTKSSALESNIDTEKNIIPQSKIDKYVENDQDSALKIVEDSGEIMIPQSVEVDNIENTKSSSALESNIDIEKIMILQPKMDKYVENDQDSALEIVENRGEIMIPQLKIDETVQNVKEIALKFVEEITVSHLKNGKCVENDQDSALKIVEDSGEIMIPQSVEVDNIENTKNSALESNIDTEKIMIPQSKMDKNVENDQDSALEIVEDSGEIMIPRSIEIENIENTKSSVMEFNINVGEINDIKSEKYTINQDNNDFQVNEIKYTNINDTNQQPEILGHVYIVHKIRNLINPEDKVFKNSIIKDLTTYFLNDNFLFKVDALWNTTQSYLVGELIIKLLNMFNDRKYNMALFSGCLISIFREIAHKSSIPPCERKLKLILLLDAIKKYVKFYDKELWRSWFLPSIFFDWCFIVAHIFMNTNNGFIIDLNNELIIRNVKLYYKMVKHRKYLFIKQNSKLNTSHKKSGIFELSRIDDLLEIDELYAIKSDNKVISNSSINITSKEPKLKTNDNCIKTINHAIPENLGKACPAPVNKVTSNIPINISSKEPLHKKLKTNDNCVKTIYHATPENVEKACPALVNQVLSNISINIPSKESKHKKLKTNNNCVKAINHATPENLGKACPDPVNKVTSNISINKSSNEPIRKKLKTNDNCVNTINRATPENVEKVCHTPVYPKIYVNPIYNVSNSFVKKCNWFNIDVSNLRKKLNATLPNESIESSIIVQNNTTNVDNNILPLVGKKGNVALKKMNKPTKTKKSKITYSSSIAPINSSSKTSPISSLTIIPQNSSSSTFHQNSNSSIIPQNLNSSTFLQNSSSLTIPRYSSSSTQPQNSLSLTVPQYLSSLTIPQYSSSSTQPQNSRSLTVPQNSSSLTIPQYSSSSTLPQNSCSLTIPQNSNSSIVPQHLNSSTFLQNSSSSTFPQDSRSLTVPQYLSPYYNNISTGSTQVPINCQIGSSIAKQTSSSMNTYLPVNINSQLSKTTLPPVSSNKWPPNLYQQSTAMNSQSLKTANSCPLNVTNTTNIHKNLYNDPSCNECAYLQPYMDSTSSYLQSSCNENSLIINEHSQLVNLLTRPTNHVQPIPKDTIRNITATMASINNAYIQDLNNRYNVYNHGNSLLNQNNLQTHEYNPQVSPDLPDAQLPNMPNHLDSDTRNKMKSDWHYPT